MLPAGDGPAPVVVLVHGGFWKASYGLDLMEPLRDDLCSRGLAVFNLEYRRVGQSGGGYPGTLFDVAAGIDALAGASCSRDVDVERVAVVGHSAGGHLALWAASRHLLPPGAPGASPRVVPTFVVGQAAVTDLEDAALDGLGSGAVRRFLDGTPDDRPDAYSVAQPAIGAVPTLLVSGDRDDDVPAAYTRRCAGIDGVEVLVVDGEDHFDVIDPAGGSWAATVTRLTGALRPTPRGDAEHAAHADPETFI